jgi:hypothetical protein
MERTQLKTTSPGNKPTWRSPGAVRLADRGGGRVFGQERQADEKLIRDHPPRSRARRQLDRHRPGLRL